jgi:hypothetical protein
MTIEPRFLAISEVMEIHDQEIATAGGMDLKLTNNMILNWPIEPLI